MESIVKYLPDTPTSGPRGQNGANSFADEYHSARTNPMTNATFHHPVKALIYLIRNSNGWRTTHKGIKHEQAQLELETWNGWLTCDFTADSIERFPLSLWERFRLARAARKLSHHLIMKAVLPEGSSRTVHGRVLESICFHPEEWEVCTDVVHHFASGVELVTRDGPFFLRCSPMSKVYYHVRLLHRLSLWIGVKRLIRRTAAGRICQAASALHRQTTAGQTT